MPTWQSKTFLQLSTEITLYNEKLKWSWGLGIVPYSDRCPLCLRATKKNILYTSYYAFMLLAQGLGLAVILKCSVKAEHFVCDWLSE